MPHIQVVLVIVAIDLLAFMLDEREDLLFFNNSLAIRIEQKHVDMLALRTKAQE